MFLLSFLSLFDNKVTKIEIALFPVIPAEKTSETALSGSVIKPNTKGAKSSKVCESIELVSEGPDVSAGIAVIYHEKDGIIKKGSRLYEGLPADIEKIELKDRFLSGQMCHMRDLRGDEVKEFNSFIPFSINNTAN